MIINLTAIWEKAPSKGHIGIDGGQILNALIVNGTGSMDLQAMRFAFSSVDRMGELAIAVEVEEGRTAVIYVDETDKPIRANLAEVLEKERRFEAQGASLTAEVDTWSAL